MNRKFSSLVGGAAVAGLVLAGAVAATAADAETVVKVGYFEVQGDVNNITPSAWFSEKDDDIAAITIGEDSVEFAKSAKSVGLNKLVDIPFGSDAGLAIDADGTARYSIVLTSDKVDYMRLTAVDVDVDEETAWYGTGFFKGDVRTPKPAETLTMTLDEWADAETLWGAEGILEGATISQIGARHFSGEEAGSVKSISANGTKYVFGTTAYDQADIDAAKAEVPAGHISQADADAAAAAAVAAAVAPLNTEINGLKADVDGLKADLAAANAEIAELEAKVLAAEKAAAETADRALAAEARAPYRIAGKAKVGNKLTAKGKSYKGVTVKYQWYVGSKKAGKKSSLKLKKADARKKVRVVVTKTYRNSAGKKVTVKANVKLTSNARVAR